MAALKSLSFAALPKSTNDPVSARRTKVVDRLEEQKRLLEDPNHVRSVQRWVTDNGEKRPVVKEQRIRPWWRTDATGRLFMCIKSGSRPIEFEKGKSAIAVPSREQLPKVIDTLITAVRSGELDDVLAQASKQNRIPSKPRKAA